MKQVIELFHAFLKKQTDEFLELCVCVCPKMILQFTTG